MRTAEGISPSIDLFVGAEQYCQYPGDEMGNGCFSVKTDDSQFMRDLFGDELGGQEWDDYYEVFYAKGCLGVHYGTKLKSSKSTCLEGADPGVKWRLSTPRSVQIIKDKNETINEETLTPAERATREAYLTFDLEYCCRDQQCDSGAESRALALLVGMASVVTSLMLL